MKFTFSSTLFPILLFTLLLSGTSFAQKKQSQKQYTPEDLIKMDKGKMRPPTGPRFEVVFAQGTMASYVVILHSEERTFVQDIYHASQLGIMEAIITEASQFGLTDEAAGGAKPLTTRFSDPQLPGFFVDVSKIGRQTRFYVTLKNSAQKLTVDAGGLKRTEKKTSGEKTSEEAREPILFDSLLESIRAAKQPTQ